MNKQFVFRPLALNLVCPISNELQELLQQERLALGLINYDENPNMNRAISVNGVPFVRWYK